MFRSRLASVLGLGTALAILLGAAGPASASRAAPNSRAAHRHAAPCRPAPKRHGKRRKTTRCRRPTKTHGVNSTDGSTSNGSSAPRPAPTVTAAAAPSTSPGPTVIDPSGSTPPPLPVTAPSAWDEPALDDPITVQLSSTNFDMSLSQSQDYILQCPPGGLTIPNALNIAGGHNVVLENCNVELSNPDWAAKFSDQTGTLWVEGVHFGGSQLTGGMQLQEPGATVVMRDVLFDTVYGSQSTNHAELIQTWAGPSRLLIDGLTGSTTYQGLFLLPNQYFNGPPPTVIDLRHIDIDDSEGAYALWLGDVTGSPPDDASGPILTWNVEDVYVVPSPTRTWPGWWLWPQPSTGDPTWDDALAGSPAGGPYVQATSSGAAGVDEGAEPPALLGEQP